MPRSLRALLRAMGAYDGGGRQLLSYLLFERGYTRALMQLGLRDAMARREEIARFLGGEPRG
jgi:NTE family protein